ncbi:hypothetical protein [Hymenobacter guriensis]|uniref:PBCV-specific basic adaptor domain-containing protein n=1 Tax=Hymenobacter guriensis TaxID=2793065 RepID=A0ABS0L311_9BACT|nr:hypothetical protein [Hymenobacter guriensis]MBG8553963.1 hypothetical protein [Hymenobacter guriensis]
MFRILLLVCALLFVSGASQSVEAARPSAYAKAKMKGRIFTHRPVYKTYKGRKKAKKPGFFQLRRKAKAPAHTTRRSTRYTTH